MRIVIFGTERCLFCEKQKKIVKNSFHEDDWIYIDIIKDKDGLEIAEQVGVEHFPTVIILGERNEILCKKSGTLSADRIFKILNKKSYCIPIKKNNIKVFSKKVILSYDPKFKKGQKIEVYSYSGKRLFNAKIISCRKTEVNKINSNLKKEYQDLGGRLDVGWLVIFNRT